MPACLIGVLSALLLCVAGLPVPASAEDAWRDDGDSAAVWVAQPGWIPNPSAGADVRAADGVLVFSVPEPNRAMKFSRSVRSFPLSFYRYLVLRYRAENLREDLEGYFVYLNDGGPRECHALRLRDLRSDGEWHTVAVDVSRLAVQPTITALAVQAVTTARGGGRLFIDWITFSDALPAGAQELRQPEPTPVASRPDWVLPLATSGWTARRDWLGNPGQNPRVVLSKEGLTFRVAEAYRGMKWSLRLPEAVPLQEYAYLTLRYRAEGFHPAGDYALCVIGTPGSDGLDYTAVVAPGALVADGSWHTLNVPLAGAAARFPTIHQIAFQVQTGARPGASLTVAALRFTNKPTPPPVSDFVRARPGWPAETAGFLPLSLTSLPPSPARQLQDQLGLADWLSGERITAEGVPFALRAGGREVCRTGVLARQRLAVPVGRRVSAVYLLLATLFAGEEEDVRGGGSFAAFTDVDRFRVRLEYADGIVHECLPLDVRARTRRVPLGPRVLCAFADPKRTLARVVLDDRCGSAAFALLAATAHTGARCPLEAYRLRPALSPQTPAGRLPAATAPTLKREGGRLRLANGRLEAELTTTAGLRLSRLARVVPGKLARLEEALPKGGGPLLTLTLAGKPLPPAHLPVASIQERAAGGRKGVDFTLSGRGPAAGLRVQVRVSLGTAPELLVEATLTNTGTRTVNVGVRGPGVTGVRIGARAADNYYLFPQCGAVWNNVPVSLEQPFCGLFPVQFLDVYNRRQGGGVWLRTEDRVGDDRSYTLRRGEDGLTDLGTAYPERPLAPGARRPLVRTLIGVHPGDWRPALAAYQTWLRRWYRPVTPRKPWFREIFNFRQRFLWWLDPLYQDGFHLDRAITEAQQRFGGIDYLHLFDWGVVPGIGRVYGRTGDHSPYDHWQGGLPAFREAIAGVQAKGVPVGLYIEGYLLEERGKLGQTHGKEWQRVDATGQRAYWPGATEAFICPWLPAWREVQADTYHRAVRDMNVDGMYLDQFGFCSPHFAACHSPDHGHPVPGSALLGERGLTRMVRQRIEAAKPGVALYSEETPPDVNSLYQDGSFTYALARARAGQSRVPLNLTRFAIPSFKTFEILVCDKPTASWATGVHWVFFNGEGIWLEGPAEEWFEPQTLAAIRRGYRILRAHRDAFAGDDVEALVPTRIEGIFANAFNARGKRVLTLYNSHPETVSGELLRLPHRSGRRYEDAWNRRELRPRINSGYAYLRLTLGPHEPGCVVIRD